MATRTDRINTTRGLLREFGLDLPLGPAAVRTQAPTWRADPDSPIPLPLRTALTERIAEIRTLDTRIAAIEQQLRAQAKQRPEIQRLMTVPGSGLLIATALIAAVGGMAAFRDGRHLAAWLGLTPRESSSGQRRCLGGISKRGDRYLRMLFIHGARSALLAAMTQDRAGKKPLTRLQRWAVDLAARVGHNKAACAPANKLARIAFAVVRQGRTFKGFGDQWNRKPG